MNDSPLPRIGVDLVDCERIRRLIERGDTAFMEKVFTPGERAYCDRMADPVPHYAARFAAKEAVAKAFETGIGEAAAFRDIEVIRQPGKAPRIELHGAAIATAARLGISAFRLSLSHTNGHAVAMVVGG